MNYGDNTIGHLDWEACEECFFGGDGDCNHPRGPAPEVEDDDVICENFSSEGEFVELTPELEAKIDAPNQAFLFPEVKPFRPRVFEREDGKFIKDFTPREGKHATRSA